MIRNLLNTISQSFPDIPGYSIIEQLYQGSQTIVYRAVQDADQRLVVIKLLRQEYPSLSELVQFRNQYAITKNLDIPGIIHPLSLNPWKNGYALIMEDVGSISLQQYLQHHSLSLEEILVIGIQLADILHDLCDACVVHKDIKPANIIIHPQSKQIKLIDFSIASLLPKENPEIQNPNILEGTLAYLAPEQTGRMNRGIDYRADFYALGVTLYELLSGELPFQSDDPLELVHCHIAKMPDLEKIEREEIPQVLSDIVLKLMAKNAEDRYQNALGLKHDLEQCLSEWQTEKKANFELGKRDFSDRFIIPEKLYGRESEVQMLLKTFEEVTAGSRELMLVAGYSGIGKTAVINELYKPITHQQGYFIKGKFDQFNRNIPLAAFVQAFRNLMVQLLSESDQNLKVWKAKILEAIGEHGQVIIAVIPELEHIIGTQKPVQELSGNAAQNRFNLLFEKFISVFTTKEHPLVIFLDDLQWADLASLNLLKLLMNESERGYLFLLGAYRDHEIFSTHPLMLTLNEIYKQNASINILTLKSLNEADITRLVADTLLCSLESARLLSQLVYQKTQGNPFFTIQFLKGLHQDSYIKFDKKVGYWQCDLTQIRQLSLTDDVVEFMVSWLQKLPEATQKVLKLAACIGNQFSLETLAIVSEQSLENTAANLWGALQEGLVLPVSETYKFFQGVNSEIEPVQTILVEYRFSHDRVQQAAYSLISEDQKTITHLRIGQLLLQNTSIENLEDKIFEIVNSMNLGLELIKESSEKLQLAQLNFQAGKKAKAATAYTSAFEYCEIARSLLPTNDRVQDDEFSLLLYELSAETAYFTGNFTLAENLTNYILLNQAIGELEKVKACEVRIQVAIAKNQLLEGIEVGLKFLSSLGINLAENPSQIEIDYALSEITEKLSGKQIESLIDLPIMTDKKQLASMRILSSLLNAAYLGQPNLLPMIITKQVDLSITYGNMDISPSAYANYGLILCSIVEDIDSGYHFGTLALNLLNKIESKAFYAKTVEIVCLGVKHWKDHLDSTLEILLDAYKIGLESGDFESASFAICDYCTHSFVLGKNLIEVEQEMLNYSEVIQRLQQRMILSLNELHRQVVINLIGKTDHPSVLKGEVYNEEKMLPIYQQDNDFSSLALFYIDKLFLCYLFGECVQATKMGTQLEAYLKGIPGQVFIPIFHLYDALSWLNLYNNLEQKEQKYALERILFHQRKMVDFSSHAAMNYAHKLDLINAEKYRVLGEKIKAIESYDLAITGAKKNKYLQEEALANELAAQFYLELGKDKIAALYLQEAYYCYARWGALAKTKDLGHRYPNLLQPILQRATPSLDSIKTLTQIAAPNISLHSPIGASQSSSGHNINTTLDFAAILKASQALSRTIQLDQLLRQLTQIILQNSGGDFCAIILPNRDGEWFVAVVATLTTTELNSEPLSNRTNLPVKLIHYVKNTKQVIAIDHLKTELPIIDEYLIQQQPTSVLCLPLLNQGQLIGILYLHNQFTSGVFSRDRLLILDCLCTQAAISLENARLFSDHASAEAQLQQTNEDLLRATRLKDQFLATMSHELRTPLNAILGMTEGLQDEVFGPITEKQINALKVINRSGSHLLDLINDILDVTRIASGKIELNCTPIAVVPICQSSLALIESEAVKKGIQLKTKFSDHLPNIWADERRIRQVLLNLLENAIKFTSEGGSLTLEVSYQSQNMAVVPQQEELSLKNYLRIAVIDTGIGIAPEGIEKLFEPFIQIDSALNRKYEGIGLGLALVNRIVELHGGKVGVTSQVGVGSCFTVDLPTSSAQLETQPEVHVEPSLPEAKASPLILIAEDNEANLSTISSYLRAKGYRLLVAKNGEEAITLLKSKIPDVMVMDIQMPGIDGIDAMKQIRLDPNFVKIPIIALTALAMSCDRDQCLAAGANQYLTKPVKLRQLVTTIQELLASQ